MYWVGNIKVMHRQEDTHICEKWIYKLKQNWECYMGSATFYQFCLYFGKFPVTSLPDYCEISNLKSKKISVSCIIVHY